MVIKTNQSIKFLFVHLPFSQCTDDSMQSRTKNILITIISYHRFELICHHGNSHTRIMASNRHQYAIMFFFVCLFIFGWNKQIPLRILSHFFGIETVL